METYNNVSITNSGDTSGCFINQDLSTALSAVTGTYTINSHDLCSLKLSDEVINILGINSATNQKEKEEMNVSRETRSVLFNANGTLSVKGCINGKVVNGVVGIIPEFAGIRVYNDDQGNPCALYLDFVDGTTTCAAAREGDPFDIERGLSVCITKRLLDGMTNGSGGSVYNKLVRRAIKLYDLQLENEKREAEIEAANEARARKLAEKKRRREERILAKAQAAENEARETLIEIQKEAYLRAMREYNGSRAMAD